MSLKRFMKYTLSPWMLTNGPESSIVLSTRIRLARNFEQLAFPTAKRLNDLLIVNSYMNKQFHGSVFQDHGKLSMIELEDLSTLEKRVLVEKHLMSPHLLRANNGAILLSEDEQVSIMVNEEDHLRIQLYYPGLQLEKALKEAFALDDMLEEHIDFAFDEQLGYLTSCPTNVGTGLRASVMLHLPALVLTKEINRMIPIINQFGFAARGYYGEGSESVGNILQVSNQITLGKSEEDIISDLHKIIKKLVEREKHARKRLMKQSKVQVEDRVYRSFGILKYSRIMESQEAAKRISHIKLGIDLGLIQDLPNSLLNELMTLTQPALLQQYAGRFLTPRERDIFRATLIRERLKEDDEDGGN